MDESTCGVSAPAERLQKAVDSENDREQLGPETALFDSLAPFYDSWFQTPLGSLCYCWEREAILRAARPQPGERALDVGCGTGLFTAELAQRGASVTGLDMSAEMLEVARRRAAQERLAIQFHQGRADSLPFPSRSFHLVMTVTMLEFVASPKAVVAEMARVIRPGGRMVVAALNSRGLWAWQRRNSGQDPIYGNAHFYSPADLVELLAPYGRVGWDACVFAPPWYWPPLGLLYLLCEAMGHHLWRGAGAFVVAKCQISGGRDSGGES